MRKPNTPPSTWYSLALWRAPKRGLKARVWNRDGGRCQMPGCGVVVIAGREAPNAGVVDHKRPHRGDWALFRSLDNLWLLCKACHDQRKQVIELRGFDPAVDEDGWPVDASHPAMADDRGVV